MSEPTRTFRFFIAGNPQPMTRVKASRCGGFVRMYNPKGPWSEWKARVIAKLGAAPKPTHDGPVLLDIEYSMPRPKSLPKRIPDGAFCWRKPDIDNMEKLIMDALVKAGWFTDDGRVVAVNQRKTYSEVPGVMLSITMMVPGAKPEGK